MCEDTVPDNGRTDSRHSIVEAFLVVKLLHSEKEAVGDLKARLLVTQSLLKDTSTTLDREEKRSKAVKVALFLLANPMFSEGNKGSMQLLLPPRVAPTLGHSQGKKK